MRIVRIAAPAGVLLMMALAGCTGNGGTSSAYESSSPQVTSTAGGSMAVGGPAPACLVGTWRSEPVSASGQASGATASLQGGGGTMLNIDRDGRVQVDFTRMQPLNFSAMAGGKNIKGQSSYTGTARGAVRFPSAPASTGASSMSTASPATSSGTWEPARADWNGVRVTAKLTEPVSATVLDNASLSDLNRDRMAQTGNAVDGQPVLRKGSYTCGKDTLTISPGPGGPPVNWVFRRT